MPTSIRRGEIHALLGGNGSGKLTSIKTLAGVHRPDTGTISPDGTVIDTAVRNPAISFIRQDLGLIDAMTIAENHRLGPRLFAPIRYDDWRAPARALNARWA